MSFIFSTLEAYLGSAIISFLIYLAVLFILTVVCMVRIVQSEFDTKMKVILIVAVVLFSLPTCITYLLFERMLKEKFGHKPFSGQEQTYKPPPNRPGF